jgi:hypothetical protein
MNYWHNKPITVTARSLPRFIWTTASIDVFLDGQCILRTGGQAKLTGGHSASFTEGGSPHQVELTWELSRGFGFPYKVLIDGAVVEEGNVQIENRFMIIIPALLIVIILFAVFGSLLYWGITMWTKSGQ